MSEWVQARTVIEQEDVQAAKDDAVKKFDRFEEMWDGLVWLLARRGGDLDGVFHKIENGKKYYLYKAESVAKDLPDIIIIYTATEEEVTIYGMHTHDTEQEARTATVTKIHSGR